MHAKLLPRGTTAGRQSQTLFRVILYAGGLTGDELRYSTGGFCKFIMRWRGDVTENPKDQAFLRQVRVGFAIERLRGDFFIGSSGRDSLSTGKSCCERGSTGGSAATA